MKTEAEDGIIVTDDFAAVIDGSTSKSTVNIHNDVSNGRYCMLLICDYIKQAKKDIDVVEFCKGVTEFVRSHYDKDLLIHLSLHPEERMAASCVIYSNYHKQIWMIGDCQCIVEQCFYDNPKPYEAVLAERRSEIAIQMIEQDGITIEELTVDDKARKAIIPEMIEYMKEQNKSYAVIDGFDIPMKGVRIIKLLENEHNIILASDGYPSLKPTLELSEKCLESQLASDPLNIFYFKATKACMKGNNSFDDRTFLKFIV